MSAELEPKQKNLAELLNVPTLKEYLAKMNPENPDFIEVKVRRSSGEIDNEGWAVIALIEEDPNNIKVQVVKDGAGRKVVSLDDLKKWNGVE